MTLSLRVRLGLTPLEARENPTGPGLYTLEAGTGGPPRLQVYSSITGAKIADFLAYEPTFTGGINAAVSDVNNDGFPDIIVGAGVSGGPRVRVFDGRAFRPGQSTFAQAPTNGTSFLTDTAVIADFFAYESTQRGGSFVSGGNFSGTGFSEVVIGAGPGGGPRVRILDGQQITTQGRNFTSDGPLDTVANFFAFESTFRNGVAVSASPTLLGVQFSDLVVAPNLGGGPRVRLLNGTEIANERLSYSSFGTNDALADFFAADPNTRTGLFVSLADFNSDTTADIAVGTGPGLAGRVTIYDGSVIRQRGGNFTGNQAGDIFDQFPVDPTPVDGRSGSYSNGVTVGATLQQGGTITVGGALLQYGVGGQGRVGEGIVLRLLPAGGFVTRQVVYDQFLDPQFLGPIFVGN